MKRRKACIPLPFALLALLVGFSSSPVSGEVSVRECIRLLGGPGGLLRLPASSTSDLLTMEFNLFTPSDGIFDVSIFNQDSGTPLRTRARYNLLIDGATTYRLDSPGKEYLLRTPPNTDGAVNLRFHFAGIPAGNHTATLRVINTSLSAIDVAGVYMTPLFVDASEEARIYDVSGSLALGSGWAVIGQLTGPTTSNRHLHLSSYIKASNAGRVQFAYRVNGAIVDAVWKDFKNLDDGFFYHYTVENANPSANITLEAQGPATIATTEMTAQTLQRYSIHQGFLGTNTSVPQDFSYHVLFSSPPITLNALSLSGPQCCVPGHRQVCFWGNGWLEMSSTQSAETAIQFWHRGTNADFEAGNIGHSPNPLSSTYSNPTSLVCGTAFFGAPEQYRVEVQLAGFCSGGPPIAVNKGRVQVIVVPAPALVPFPNPGFDAHTCTTSWWNNCVYKCDLNPNLTKVTAPPRNFCN